MLNLELGSLSGLLMGDAETSNGVGDTDVKGGGVSADTPDSTGTTGSVLDSRTGSRMGLESAEPFFFRVNPMMRTVMTEGLAG